MTASPTPAVAGEGQAISVVLDRAADLIEPEGAWTQGVGARDKRQRWTPPSDQDAVCWCITGAVGRVAATNTLVVKSLEVVMRSLRRRGDFGVIGKWNDAPERTQAEVVAKLREAAALAREQGL